MALEHWSSSASGNASPTGINFAEGQAPSTVNNSAREMMAQVRAKYYATEWVWIKNSATASVATQTTFKVAGDQTAQFEANRRVRLTGGSATRYASITSASFTTETTITIVVDSGSLSASMSVVAISAVDQNATPAAAAVAYLTSNSASIMIAAAAMPPSGGVFTGPVGHSATASFSGAAQFNAGVSISGAMVAAGASTFKASASFSNSVNFRGLVNFSGTASFGGPAKFAGSVSFSNSVHFRGPVGMSATLSVSGFARFGQAYVATQFQVSGTASFVGTVQFLSSASFSGSVNFAGSINVSATASVGALTIGGVAFAGGPAILGTATFPAQSIRFSGSWSDYPILQIFGTVKTGAGSGDAVVSAYTDGGTTAFLGITLDGTSRTLSDAHAMIRVSFLGNGNARKSIMTEQVKSAAQISGQDAAFEATTTANAGFINAIEYRVSASFTLSSGNVYLIGWR